jgi:signal transduction histidine kinase
VRVEGSAFTVPLPVMRALLRVAEEAVENTEQHASVNAVNVTLRFDAPTVMIEVVDDGVGFDVAAAERRSTGVGLFRARELLAHAGGAMHIRSSPGSGTRVVATSTVVEGCDT